MTELHYQDATSIFPRNHLIKMKIIILTRAVPSSFLAAMQMNFLCCSFLS